MPFSVDMTLHFTLGFIMLNVKQGGIEYHFFKLWKDSIWDWISFFWAIGEHSTQQMV